MVDPAVGALVLLWIALLFVSAAIHKVRDLRRFEEIFTAYGLVPLPAAWRPARIVPVLEVLVAAGLLLAATRRVAVFAGIALLSAYAVAIAVNLRRGRRDLACGCGGPDERRPIAPWMVWRNVLLALLLAAVAMLPWSARQWVLTDLVTVGGGTVAGALIYLILDRLLSRGGLLTAGLRMSS